MVQGHQLCKGSFHQGLCLLIRIGEHAGPCINDEDRIAGMIHEGAVLLVLSSQLVFGPLAFCDVGPYTEQPGAGAFFIVDRFVQPLDPDPFATSRDVLVLVMEMVFRVVGNVFHHPGQVAIRI